MALTKNPKVIHHFGAFSPDGRQIAYAANARNEAYFDLYVMDPTQKVITDRLRPPGEHVRFGVAQARDKLRAALDLIEHEFARDNGKRLWAAGHRYSMADCAASPALFYANFVIPLEDDHPQTAAYLLRLMERPSFARVLREAQPYLHMVPREPAEA